MERMNSNELAKYLGVTAYKVREMVRQKKIPAYRVGNRIFFRKDTIDEWIAQQEKANCEHFMSGVK